MDIEYYKASLENSDNHNVINDKLNANYEEVMNAILDNLSKINEKFLSYYDDKNSINEKIEIKVNDDFTIKVEPELHEKGLILFITSDRRYYGISRSVITITPLSIKYIYRYGEEYYGRDDEFVKEFKFNEDIYQEELNVLGKKIDVKRKETLFNKNIKNRELVSFTCYLDIYKETMFDPEKNIVEKIDEKENQKKLKEIALSRAKGKMNSALKNYLDSLNEYKKLANNEIISRVRIVPEILFEVCEDHLVIKPEYVDKLIYFKLLGISFDNVDIRGIDFSNTDANINPQTVYNKDLSDCDLTGIVFGFADFTGVNITNTKLDYKINPMFVNIDKTIINTKEMGMKI